MAQEFRLEDPGEGIAEAEIVEVHAAQGDQVQEGDVVFVVETDKAAVEIPAPFTGTVESVEVQEDERVEVGDLLLTYTESDTGAEAGGEAKQEEGRQGAGTEEAEAEEEEAEEEEAEEEEAEEEEAEEEEAAGGGVAGPLPEEEEAGAGRGESPEPGGRKAPEHGEHVLASPVARRMAEDLDVDLETLEGSGPQGRITTDDVEAAAGREKEEASGPGAEESEESRGAEAVEEAAGEERPRAPGILGHTLVEEVPSLPDFREWGEVERTKLRSVRRTIAERMAVAWSQIPHVTHEDVADITALETLRREHAAEVEEAGGSLTLTTFVLKAAVAALKAHPRFNASLDVEARELVLKKYYHVGVAVHTERGLMVPVIRDVDRKSVKELAVELTELAERTRDGDVKPREMRGGTFTVTNPGTIGGTSFTPIINWPQVGILGTARARRVPAVSADPGGGAGSGPSSPAARLQLPIVLGFDHRVNDGADAARFARTVVEVLEDPEKLLLEA